MAAILQGATIGGAATVHRHTYCVSQARRRLESNYGQPVSREKRRRYFLKTFAKMGPASASSTTGTV